MMKHTTSLTAVSEFDPDVPNAELLARINRLLDGVSELHHAKVTHMAIADVWTLGRSLFSATNSLLRAARLIERLNDPR